MVAEITEEGSRDQKGALDGIQGFQGLVRFDDDANLFHGDVVNTRDVITFQGESVEALKKAFKESIDDYLEFCKARGEEPEKPFSGKFLIRMKPELHRRVAVAARRKGKSINQFAATVLERASN